MHYNPQNTIGIQIKAQLNLGHGEVCELWQLLDDLREKVIVGANIVRWERDQVKPRETVFRELQCLVEQLGREEG